MSVYDYSFNDNAGNVVSLSNFKDNVLLLVNVASQCGLTPQYADLQNLNEKYSSSGLKVIGFPCNQFGNQEPGTDEEIKEFCSTKYNVTFTLSTKIDVNGENAHPLYQYLNSVNGFDIPWNFNKFIVSKDGEIHGLSPDTEFTEVEELVVKLLA